MIAISDMIKRQCLLKHFRPDLISKFKQDCSVHKSTPGAEQKPLGCTEFSKCCSDIMLIDETKDIRYDKTDDDYIHSILNGIPKSQSHASISSSAKTLSVRQPNDSENTNDGQNISTNNYPLITGFSSQHRILNKETSVQNTIPKVLKDIYNGSPNDSKVNQTILLKGGDSKSSEDNKGFTEALQASIKCNQLATSQLDNTVPPTSTVSNNQNYSTKNGVERKFKTDKCEQTTQISSPKDLNSFNGDADRFRNKDSRKYLSLPNKNKEQYSDKKKGNYGANFYNFFPEKPQVAQNVNPYSSKNEKLMRTPERKEEQFSTQKNKTPCSKTNIQPLDWCGKNFSDTKNEEPSITEINITSSPQTSTPSSFQCVQTSSIVNPQYSSLTNQTHPDILSVETSMSQKNQQSSDKSFQPLTTQRDIECEENNFTSNPIVSSNEQQTSGTPNGLPSSSSSENPLRSLNMMPTSTGNEQPCSALNDLSSSSSCEIPISSLNIMTASSHCKQPYSASNVLASSSSNGNSIRSLNIMPTNSSFEQPYSVPNELTSGPNNVKSFRPLNISPITSIYQKSIKVEQINDSKYSNNTNKQSGQASSTKPAQLSSSHYENPFTSQTFEGSTPFRRVFQFRNEQTSTPQIESINTTLKQTSPMFTDQNEKMPISQAKIQNKQAKSNKDLNLDKREETTFDGTKTNEMNTKSSDNDTVIKNTQVVFPGIYNPVFSSLINVTFCDKRSAGKIRKHGSFLNRSMRSKIRCVIENEARKQAAQNYATLGSIKPLGQSDNQIFNTHLNQSNSDQNKKNYSNRTPQIADSKYNDKERVHKEIKNNEPSEISNQHKNKKNTHSRELLMDNGSTEKITEMLKRHTQLLEILLDRVNFMGRKKQQSEQEKPSSQPKALKQRNSETCLNPVELVDRLTQSAVSIKHSEKNQTEKEPQISSEKLQSSTTIKKEDANNNKSETKHLVLSKNENKNRDSYVPGSQLGVKSLIKIKDTPFKLTEHQSYEVYKTSNQFGDKLAQNNYNPLKQILSEYPINALKPETVNKPILDKNTDSSIKPLQELNKKKPKEQNTVDWNTTSYANYVKNKQTQMKTMMKFQPDYSTLKIKVINKTPKAEIKKKAKKINAHIISSVKKPNKKLLNALKPQQLVTKPKKIKLKTTKEKIWEEKLQNLKFSKGIFFKQKNQSDKNNSRTTLKKTFTEPFTGFILKNEIINDRSKINLKNNLNVLFQSDQVLESSNKDNAIKPDWNWRGTNQFLEGPSWNQMTEYDNAKDQWSSPSAYEKIARIYPRVVMENKQSSSEDNARKTIEYLHSLSEKIKSNKASFNNVITSSLAFSTDKSKSNGIFNIQKRFKSEKLKQNSKLNIGIN